MTKKAIIDEKGKQLSWTSFPGKAFETYRPKCDRCGCYLTDDNRVNDLCKACDDYFEQSQAKQNDAVNHPSHYTSDNSGIECIEIAEHLPFCLGNCYKYLHRAGLKGDELEDLQKAEWYAKRAFLNGEKIPNDYVKNRINKVARHRIGKIASVLQAFSVFGHDDGALVFHNALSNRIKQLGGDNA